MLFITILVISLSLLCPSVGDMFASLSDLEVLIKTQADVLNRIENYMTQEKTRLRIVTRYLENMQQENEKAIEDIDRYLGNPINAYRLVRMTTISALVEFVMKKNTGYLKNTNLPYPTEMDLEGAAQGLTRLETTYELNITELANGTLRFSQNGKMYFELTTPLDASDCHQLGKLQEDHLRNIQWMTEAYNKIQIENQQIQFVKEENIIQEIVTAFCYLDDFNNALDWSIKQKKLKPAQLENKRLMLELAKDLERRFSKLRQEEQLREKKSTDLMKEQVAVSYKHLRSLCFEDVEILKEQSHLKCSYKSGPHPFLTLARIKSEQLYQDPDIWMFHEVVYDTEIRGYLQWAEGKVSLKSVKLSAKLQRAASHSKQHERVAKAVGVKKKGLISGLLRRTTHFTDLEIDDADAFQLLNYGIGGHNDMHHDWFGKRTAEVLFGNAGDRLATIVFYLSNVSLGGMTIFPALRLKVFPERGAALFWKNLDPSGDVDYTTYHQSCPVLRGYKWIGTKWIHEISSDICPIWYTKDKQLMSEKLYLRRKSDFKNVTILTKKAVLNISL